jgi:hypothetical protein
MRVFAAAGTGDDGLAAGAAANDWVIVGAELLVVFEDGATIRMGDD